MSNEEDLQDRSLTILTPPNSDPPPKPRRMYEIDSLSTAHMAIQGCNAACRAQRTSHLLEALAPFAMCVCHDMQPIQAVAHSDILGPVQVEAGIC